MGTKNNPGKFDCYAAAEPDEPMFVLLGRDPHAAVLVTLWALLRGGQVIKAIALLATTKWEDVWPEKYVKDREKIDEARACAAAMQAWYNTDNLI